MSSRQALHWPGLTHGLWSRGLNNSTFVLMKQPFGYLGKASAPIVRPQRMNGAGPLRIIDIYKSRGKANLNSMHVLETSSQ